MTMDKSELLADLASKLGEGFIVGTPDLVETVENEDQTHNIKRYYVIVTTTGLDKDAGPVGQKRSLEFYVKDEESTDEEAYYKDANWKNPEDKIWSGSTLEDMYIIYTNDYLRNRTHGAMMKAAFDIINESPSTEKHDIREELAGLVLSNPDSYLNSFMFFISTNATVQSTGPQATDNDIQYIVNSNWNNVAEALKLTGTG
jgi:hypothetical protein